LQCQLVEGSFPGIAPFDIFNSNKIEIINNTDNAIKLDYIELNINELDNQPRIDEAAELSLASDVVKDLKLGYQQQLGKRFTRGMELSGGQWQKIALARAYMKDAAVLILDEPTSALDARAESEVFERFIGLTKGKTSIIISHRFSTVRMADHIMVLEDGRVLEMGTHEALMENKKLYAELFSLQAAGYQ
jgi:ATP-binding cassette subfamily B protein